MMFALLGNGSFNRVIINGDKTKQTTAATASDAVTVQPIDAEVKNVVTNKTSDNETTVNIRVTLEVRNLNHEIMVLSSKPVHPRMLVSQYNL